MRIDVFEYKRFIGSGLLGLLGKIFRARFFSAPNETCPTCTLEPEYARVVKLGEILATFRLFDHKHNVIKFKNFNGENLILANRKTRLSRFASALLVPGRQETIAYTFLRPARVAGDQQSLTLKPHGARNFSNNPIDQLR